MIEGIHNHQIAIGNFKTDSSATSAETRDRAPDGRVAVSGDSVQISSQGRDLLNEIGAESAGKSGDESLSAEEKREVENLKKTDQEVKAHERAHMAAGAGLVQGGASYQYQRGPDGKMYAVGGEVKIDTSREKDPKDTIRKMQQVKRAALAPSQPSGQDRSVAARASQIEAQARMELQKQNAGKDNGKKSEDEVSIGINPAGSQNPYNSSKSEPKTVDIVV